MIEIELPLPHKNLSPNSRCHYMAKAKAAKGAREFSKFITAIKMIESDFSGPSWRYATVEATFYFPTNRRRDKDNLLASLKNVFDGLADSGLIANDSGLTHLPVKVEIDKDNPRVVLRVSETKGGS